jgi:hypothetical protein
MKKYIALAIILVLIAAIIFIRYEIAAPAKAAAHDLEAINGIIVGKTTEAELLGRSAFQTIDRQCHEGACLYHMHAQNTFLNSLHLAPRTWMSIVVEVNNGMVTGVSVMTMRWGLPPISLRQVATLPSECNSNPCVKRMVPPNKVLASIRVLFNGDSELRNQMPESVNPECFSRLHGCNTYAELLPGTRSLNLDAVAALK